VWAPTAQSVQLLRFKGARGGQPTVVEMEKGERGVWACEGPEGRGWDRRWVMRGVGGGALQGGSGFTLARKRACPLKTRNAPINPPTQALHSAPHPNPPPKQNITNPTQLLQVSRQGLLPLDQPH